MFTKFHPAFPPAGEWGGPGPHKSRVSRVVSREVVALRSEVVSCLTTGQAMLGRCDALPEGVTSVEGEAKDSILIFVCMCMYVSMGIRMLLRMCGLQDNLWESVFSFYHVGPSLLVNALTH